MSPDERDAGPAGPAAHEAEAGADREPAATPGADREPAAAESGDAAAAAAESEPEPGSDLFDEPVDPAQAVAERDAYLADLQRVTAEFANYRRQTERRNAEIVAHAASKLAEALLPTLDACDAAAGQGVEGIEVVRDQLLGVLCAEGLAVLGAVDEPFDPAHHEAVMAEESAADEAVSAPAVAEVFRTGYAWRGRVLRAAMVKVRG